MISTWSSGTGGAGIFGSFSYAALISIGVSPVHTMLLMLSVPLIEGAAFWFLLRNPCTIPKRNSETEIKTVPDDQETAPQKKEETFTLGDKIRYVPSLLKYMVPLSSVYLFEYFINQGLVSIIYCCFFINLLLCINFFPLKLIFSLNWFISKTFGLIMMRSIDGCKWTIKLVYLYQDLRLMWLQLIKFG